MAKKRRIMHSLTLKEISGVDVPAQEGARVLLMKRDFSQDERDADAKSGAAMPDGSYPIESAADLKNAMRAVGRAKNRAAVTRHIKARAKALGLEDLLSDAFKSAEVVEKEWADPMLTSIEGGHQHVLDGAEAKGGSTSYDKMEGDDYGHSHAWVRATDGSITIAMAEGHTHSVLAKSNAGGDVSDGGSSETQEQDRSMKDDAQNAAAEKDLKATKEQLSELQVKLARAEKLAQLSDSERGHMAKLDTQAQERFLALDAQSRRGELSKAAELNPVVFKSADGTEYRQSDDPRLVKAARDNDETRAQLRKERSDREALEFSKRAAVELKNASGSEVAKVALLRAVEGISDAGVRAEVKALIKGANDSLAKLFEERGFTSPAGGDAESKLEALAKAYSESRKVSMVVARDEVLRTTEGQELALAMRS